MEANEISARAMICGRRAAEVESGLVGRDLVEVGVELEGDGRRGQARVAGRPRLVHPLFNRDTWEEGR